MVYAQMEKSGKKLYMVGLDVTRQIVLRPDLLSYMERLEPLQGAFIRRITKFYYDFHWEQERLIGCVINDPLAVAYALDPQICSGCEAYVQIETDGLCRGQSVVDAHGFCKKEANAYVLTEVDVKKFFSMFFALVLHKSASELIALENIW